MPRTEVTLLDRLDVRISQLVKQAEYLDQEPIQDQLSTGLKASYSSGSYNENVGYVEWSLIEHDEGHAF